MWHQAIIGGSDGLVGKGLLRCPCKMEQYSSWWCRHMRLCYESECFKILLNVQNGLLWVLQLPFGAILAREFVMWLFLRAIWRSRTKTLSSLMIPILWRMMERSQWWRVKHTDTSTCWAMWATLMLGFLVLSSHSLPTDCRVVTKMSTSPALRRDSFFAVLYP